MDAHHEVGLDGARAVGIDVGRVVELPFVPIVGLDVAIRTMFREPHDAIAREVVYVQNCDAFLVTPGLIGRYTRTRNVYRHQGRHLYLTFQTFHLGSTL